MNQKLAYQTLRTLASAHSCVKRTQLFKMQFRYDEVSVVTASAIKEAARACIRQSDLSRALDLKTKLGKGSTHEAAQERDLLNKIIASDENNIDAAMHDLVSFYASLSKRGAA